MTLLDLAKIGLSLLIGGLIALIAMAISKRFPKVTKEVPTAAFSVAIGAVVFVVAEGLSQPKPALAFAIRLAPYAGVGIWMIIVFYIWASSQAKIRALDSALRVHVEAMSGATTSHGKKLDALETASKNAMDAALDALKIALITRGRAPDTDKDGRYTNVSVRWSAGRIGSPSDRPTGETRRHAHETPACC